MIVYHGSTEIVEKPDVRHSYRALDFGKGFYVTTVKEQAEIYETLGVSLQPRHVNPRMSAQRAVQRQFC